MWPWLPTLLVIAVTAMALTMAGSTPATANGRRAWMACIMVCGYLAIVATVWQGQKASSDHAALSGTTSSPVLQRGQSEQASADLTRQIKTLEERVSELDAGRQVRTIAQETAEKLASYLRGFGEHRVIVSCAPDDLEAYQYANRLVTVLKAADWQAQGPQVTRIFGDVRSPAVNFYVASDDPTDTAKILLGAFDRFNIPYQSRVTPSGAIPDPETVELFVGTMRSG
jgi:hypothetical protein